MLHLCGMTNGAQRMHQLSINLPPELFEFVQKAAERETRPVSTQIRHYIAEAARRASTRIRRPGVTPFACAILREFSTI